LNRGGDGLKVKAALATEREKRKKKENGSARDHGDDPSPKRADNPTTLFSEGIKKRGGTSIRGGNRKIDSELFGRGQRILARLVETERPAPLGKKKGSERKKGKTK